MPRSKKSDPNTYTKPDLRDHIKEEVTAGEKGGNPGQWSARKAQLVAQEYEREGGGYKQHRNETQKSLQEWGDEHWTTADGKKARRDGTTARYLPEEAWKQLTAEEKEKTDQKKRKASRAGQQFVANTNAAASARKKVKAKAKASAPSPARKKAPKKASKKARKKA